MTVIIIEDEKAAVRRLTQLLNDLKPDVIIASIIDTVIGAIDWFNKNPAPDLAFFDIQLADGTCFEIFEEVTVHCPVIFTTAYDRYALKAFEVNSIDYLLKPVDRDKLGRAFKKFEKFTGREKPPVPDPALFRQALEFVLGNSYKERFVVKYGEHLKSIPVSQVSFFMSEARATFLITGDQRRFLIDFSLEKVESMVDPARFFRISRKYLVAIDSIREMIAYSNSRLRLILNNINDPGMIVAREKTGDFKKWLDR